MLLELMNRYKKMSVGVKASLWFMGCNILQKGFPSLQFQYLPE